MASGKRSRASSNGSDLLAILFSALALLAPPDRYVAVPAASAPGPSRYDRVWVRKVGPPAAKRVLVLVPGVSGGSGGLVLIARELVDRVPNLQIWIEDRRTQAFEDPYAFTRGNPAAAASYYLSNGTVDGRSFSILDGRSVPFVREWGLKVALEDLRRVVLSARAGGKRTVILGGHSLGAATAVAYASWDFGGHAGSRDLTGLVLIDGGMEGAFGTMPLAQVKADVAKLQTSDPFYDRFGAGLPWLPGVFTEIGAQLAAFNPQGSSLLQLNPLLPDSYKPPFPVTNEAMLGYVFDGPTTPASLRVHAGELAPAGDPRPWVDGELTPIANVSSAFGIEPGNAVEWYFPQRLVIDVFGVQGALNGPTARFLGLKLTREAAIDVPLYALETDLTHGGVLRGAKRLIAHSKIPAGRSVLVAAHEEGHLDPLLAAPDRNRFLKTVVPFLRRLP